MEIYTETNLVGQKEIFSKKKTKNDKLFHFPSTCYKVIFAELIQGLGPLLEEKTCLVILSQFYYFPSLKL